MDLQIDEARCWHAVQKRDPAYNGKFFFGVRSTQIYCRPTCPARRPQRSQVLFFSTAQAAESVGYRPCKRCKPNLPVDPQAEMVARACREIDTADEPLSLTALSQRLGVSPYHLHRLFKAATGMTPRQYAANKRAQQFRANIQQGQDVTAALFNAGYGSSSQFYTNAKEHLGMTPTVYQRGGMNMEMSYTIVDSRLGRMLVATTQRGVCMVSFGSDDSALICALEQEYHQAHLTPTDAGMKEWVAALVAYLEGTSQILDLPLDVRATAFQRRVWEELRRIPYGQTRTYAQVAQSVGRPAAVRAVGYACATNPVSVITPCHRVLRSDGGLGGYRWGQERKKLLLELEKGKAAGGEEMS